MCMWCCFCFHFARVVLTSRDSRQSKTKKANKNKVKNLPSVNNANITLSKPVHGPYHASSLLFYLRSIKTRIPRAVFNNLNAFKVCLLKYFILFI